MTEYELNEKLSELFTSYGVQVGHAEVIDRVLTIGFIELDTEDESDFNEHVEIGFDFLSALSEVLGTRDINLGVEAKHESGYEYSSWTRQDPCGTFVFSLTARLPEEP